MDVKKIYQMAHSLYTAGKYVEAEELFRTLSYEVPHQIEFWMGLGGCLQLQKKYEEAIHPYGIAALLDKEETCPMPHAHAADCLYANGDIKRAQKALDSAIEIAKKEQKYHALIEKLKLLKTRWNHE